MMKQLMLNNLLKQDLCLAFFLALLFINLNVFSCIFKNFMIDFSRMILNWNWYKIIVKKL